MFVFGWKKHKSWAAVSLIPNLLIFLYYLPFLDLLLITCDLFIHKAVLVYLICYIVKKKHVLSKFPGGIDHFKLSLSHSSALRMALLMYLLTLPSPHCMLHRHILHLPFFCFLVKNVCIKKQCPNNAICQAGFSSEGYRCVCVPGYTGEDCTKGEADICVQYLSVSSHLMIRKVGDRCFK